jgi:A/G-specific adenine glycosylase
VTTSGADHLTQLRGAIEQSAARIARQLPWIGHADPWAVLVAEFMLQQTSTRRVIPKWTAFLERFPTAASCAEASLADVLSLWRGLGYPRRAKALHEVAHRVRDEFGGSVPSDPDTLRTFPGVGEYTANAVASFAFDVPVPILDTNVGRVLARAAANISLTKASAQRLAAELLPSSGVREFNQALLDIGAQFCRSTPVCDDCPISEACAWRVSGGPDPAPKSAAVSRPQAPFRGSDREIRGRVLAHLEKAPRSLAAMRDDLSDLDPERVTQACKTLESDGLVELVEGSWQLRGYSSKKSSMRA